MNISKIIDTYKNKIVRWIPIEAIIAYNLCISVSSDPKSLKQNISAIVISCSIVIILPFIRKQPVQKRFLPLSILNFFSWVYFTKLSDIVDLGQVLKWPTINMMIFATAIFGCPILYYLLKAPPQNVCSDLLDEDIEKLKKDPRYALAIVEKYKDEVTSEDDFKIDGAVVVQVIREDQKWEIDRDEWEYSMEIEEKPFPRGGVRYQLRQIPKLNLIPSEIMKQFSG